LEADVSCFGYVKSAQKCTVFNQKLHFKGIASSPGSTPAGEGIMKIGSVSGNEQENGKVLSMKTFIRWDCV